MYFYWLLCTEHVKPAHVYIAEGRKGKEEAFFVSFKIPSATPKSDLYGQKKKDVKDSAMDHLHRLKLRSTWTLVREHLSHFVYVNTSKVWGRFCFWSTTCTMEILTFCSVFLRDREKSSLLIWKIEILCLPFLTNKLFLLKAFSRDN